MTGPAARRHVLAATLALLAAPAGVRAAGPAPLRLLSALGVPLPALLERYAAAAGRSVEQRAVGADAEALALLRAGPAHYDLAILGDGLLPAIASEGLLRPLGPLASADHLDDLPPTLLQLCRWQGQLQALPWAWGRLGFAYDSALGAPPGESWGAFWVAAGGAFSGRVLLPDDAGQTVGLALQALGRDWGAGAPEALDEAAAWLSERRRLLFAVTGDPLPPLLSGDAALTPLWSSDAAALLRARPTMRFFQPSDESLLWLDALAIPRWAPDPSASNALFAWLSDPAMAAAAAADGDQAPADRRALARLRGAAAALVPPEALLARSRPADPAWSFDPARLAILANLKGG